MNPSQRPIQILTLRGKPAVAHLADLAQLRMAVFREFPYLYDGSLEYEMRYLSEYFESPNSILILAKDTTFNTIVGASTAMPLKSADDVFLRAFHAVDINIDEVHYFGESVLLPEYRGHGIGHQFFGAREHAAQHDGFPITTFCAVEREPDHPERPADHRPLDAFWKNRGYTHHPQIRCSLDWKEPGSNRETPHTLSFWIRDHRE